MKGMMILILIVMLGVEVGGGVISSKIDDQRYLEELIYEKVEFSGACVRLLSEKGEIGCSSGRDGNVGVLLEISTEKELDLWIGGNTSGSSSPVDVILLFTFPLASSPRIFSPSFFHSLSSSASPLHRIQGILLEVFGDAAAEQVPLAASSPVSATPQLSFVSSPSSSLNASQFPFSTHSWNPHGSSIALSSLPFPIIALSSLQIKQSRLSYLSSLNHQNIQSKWSIQIKSWMWASKNSHTGLSRGFCEPLGGQSVIGSLSGRSSFDPSKPILLITTRIDSFALFQELAYGADSALSGLITSLSALDTLVRSFSPAAIDSWPVQVVFAFFNGESWGFLGSTRLVEDILHFKCEQQPKSKNKLISNICSVPFKYSMSFQSINISNIAAIIDVQQVGHSSDHLYMHQPLDQIVSPSIAVQSFVNTFSRSANYYSPPSDPAVIPLSDSSSGHPLGLPPSSAAAFLRVRPDIPTILLSDHAHNFSNAFYHSHLDGLSNINIAQMCKASAVLARAIFSFASNISMETDPFRIISSTNCTLIQALLDCYLISPSCPLFRDFLEIKIPANTPPQSTYVSVFRSTNYIPFGIRFIRNFVAIRTGHLSNSTCRSDDNCDASHGQLCSLGRCLSSGSYYHDAFSTGLSYDYDNDIWKITDPSQSIVCMPKYFLPVPLSSIIFST